MTRIRIIRHEAVTACGSFEVRFPDGRDSRYFYWDDNAGRRSITGTMSSDEAKAAAQAFARAEHSKLDRH